MARKFFTDLDMQSVSTVKNLPTPASDGDAVPKSYVDSAIEGLAWKDDVRVAASSNISLASPGATVDGVSMASGDRILVRGQTTGTENGIYTWTGASTAMTRTGDADTFAKLLQAVASVNSGTDAGTTWRQTASGTTIGTDTVTWGAFGSSVPDASESTKGKLEIATQAETDAGTDDARAVTPAKLASYTNRSKRYSADIGDGSATQYTVTHNLGTRDVVVQVYTQSGNYDTVEVDVDRPTTNTVRLTFATAPASNAYRVTIVG